MKQKKLTYPLGRYRWIVDANGDEHSGKFYTVEFNEEVINTPSGSAVITNTTNVTVDGVSIAFPYTLHEQMQKVKDN